MGRADQGERFVDGLRGSGAVARRPW